jgi:4-hydroxy-tetrahydrodipicolinate reductase
MIRLAVAGAAGRMGRAILGLALKDPAIKITGALEKSDASCLGQDAGLLAGPEPLGTILVKDVSLALEDADVLIDFTHPSALEDHLKHAVRGRVGLVVGTTGLGAAEMRLLKTAAKKIPIVQSPNMSVGVNLLFKLAETAGKALGEGYDIEIAEIHHRMKKDAPSGTALKLLEVVADARGKDPEKNTVFGRRGETGIRPKGQLGVLALRGGDVVGDHTVYFLGDGERIELSHRASSRQAFAQGAVLAAKFVAKSKPALYNMFQVLGIT